MVATAPWKTLSATRTPDEPPDRLYPINLDIQPTQLQKTVFFCLLLVPPSQTIDWPLMNAESSLAPPAGIRDVRGTALEPSRRRAFPKGAILVIMTDILY